MASVITFEGVINGALWDNVNGEVAINETLSMPRRGRRKLGAMLAPYSKGDFAPDTREFTGHATIEIRKHTGSYLVRTFYTTFKIEG